MCCCFTEPNVGSNPRFIETTLPKDGDRYRWNGSKTRISNGNMSDLEIVIANEDRKRGARGLTAVLVDREISAYDARDLAKMDFEAAPTSGQLYYDVFVLEGNFVVQPRRGRNITLKTLEFAGTFMASASVRMATGPTGVARKYAKQRKLSGKVMVSFQLGACRATGEV